MCMSILTYNEFVLTVEKHTILPFSNFIPDYPCLTALTTNNDWHTDSDTDPWLWRVRIVQDGVAAYGKFFNDKACFIQSDFFPAIRALLSSNKSVAERYQDGLLSRTANHLYQVISEHGTIDSRNLRKASGLNDKENKKEYEKALVELQNFGDILITGTLHQNEDGTGWSSMCYELTDRWLRSINKNSEDISLEEASLRVQDRSSGCSEKAMKYFNKKLGLALINR